MAATTGTSVTKSAAGPTRPDPATEWDTLATALNQWGILHLAPGRVRRSGLPRSLRALYGRLWATGTSRLHQATVFLLLTHPESAADAQAAIAGLVGADRDRAMRRYVAAAALQRMARTRIAQRLGPRPLIPPAFLDDLDLPSLDEEFGRETLLVLADQEQERYGYDAWGTYQNLLDLFLGEMRGRRWGEICGLPSQVIAKAARGLELDLADAEQLIRTGEVDWRDVEATWREIRSSPTGWLRYEPAEIERRLTILRQRLGPGS